MKNIKNIIFDYGNVIFSIDFRKAQQAFKQLGISNPDEFFGHRQQDQIFDKFDRGEVTSDEFRAYVKQIIDDPAVTDQQLPTHGTVFCLVLHPGTTNYC